jgi:hypothetical protein
MKRALDKLPLHPKSVRTALALGLVLVLAAALAVAAEVGTISAPSTSSAPTSAPTSASPADEQTVHPPAEGEPAASDPPVGSQQTSVAEDSNDAGFRIAGGGAKQVVRIENRHDATYLGRGRIQLNQVHAPRVVPVNIAIAQSTLCTGCETFAVALQISLYQRGAPMVAPQNAAAAVNAACSGCLTIAVAIQYLIPVDNPTVIPVDVRRMARELEHELRELSRDRRIPVRDRLAALQGLLDRFQAFAAYLDMVVQEQAEADGTSNAGVPTPFPEDALESGDGTDPTATPTIEPSPVTEPTPPTQPSPSPDSGPAHHGEDSPSADPSGGDASPAPSVSPPTASPSAPPSPDPSSPSPEPSAPSSPDPSPSHDAAEPGGG